MKKRAIKTLSVLVAILLILQSSDVLNINTVNAIPIGGVTASSIKFSSCALSGKISAELSKHIESGLKNMQQQARQILSKIPGLGKVLGKLFGSGPAAGVIGSSVPVHDDGLNTIQGNLLTKETASDTITRCAAMEVLNYLNVNINQLARSSGRNGGAAWVRNWRNFQTDSQYRGEKVFRAVLSNTNLCESFSGGIKDLFGVKKKVAPPKGTRTGDLDPFALRSGCTLPSNFKVEDYQKDFSNNGGWEAFSRMLRPENNYYGVLFQSLDEIGRQRSLEESADINQAVANRGFLGRSGDNAKDSCLQTDDAGQCIAYKDIKTPGSTIADGVAASIKAELDVTLSADEIGELLSIATQVLVNRLKDLSNANEGDYVSPDISTVSIDPLPNSCNMVSLEDGAYPRYENETRLAVNDYLASNSSIAEASKNDSTSVSQFLEGVGALLQSRGFNSGRTLNCNNNVSKGAIMVYRPGDVYGDYFDMISGQEDGQEATIAARAQVLFVEWAGVERLQGGSGNGSGGGGGGGGDPSDPEPPAF